MRSWERIALALGAGGLADLCYSRAAVMLRRVTDHAATLDYDAVGVVGFSMGAAATLIAAAEGAPVDAVACVSCPGDPPPALAGERHHAAAWRWLVRLLGTRLGTMLHLEPGPAPLASGVAPRPLLVVHCGRDTLVREAQSRAIYARAAAPKDYVCLPRSTHAWPPAAAGAVLGWMDAHLGAGETSTMEERPCR